LKANDVEFKHINAEGFQDKSCTAFGLCNGLQQLRKDGESDLAAFVEVVTQQLAEDRVAASTATALAWSEQQRMDIKLTGQIETAKTELVRDIADTKAALEEQDGLNVAAIQAAEQSAIKGINDAKKELQTNINSASTALQDNVNAVSGSLTDAKKELQTNIDSASTSLQKDINSVSGSLADAKKELQANIDSVSSSLSSAVRKLETKDETLKTSVAALVPKINAATNTAKSAQSSASTAQTTANAAKSNANAAQTTANAAKSNANAATSTANAAKSTANAANLKGDLLMKSVKAMCIGLGFKWQNNECLPAPGSTDNNPATSCREVKESGQPTGPYFVKHSGSGVARKVYCDNSYDGGGWELIHKIDGSSDHFRYDSGYWTSSSNTYRPNVFNGNYGENVKTYGYNYGRYREVRLRWRDPHDGGTWTWSNPSGWSSGRSPQNYFNSGRHICCSRYYQVHGSMEWRASGNRFSDQGCAGSVRVAQCTSNQGCTRWGFHWNNECGYSSNDVGGGWGIRPIHGAKSAGDWITCCQRHHGRRRDFDANMWARK